MPVLKKWSLALAAAAVVTLSMPAAFAGKGAITMQVEPTSGPPGVGATVSSVTACGSTDGVYDVTAKVGLQPDLLNGPALGTQALGDGGPWSIPITIPADAEAGTTITLYGQCIGTPNNSGSANGAAAVGDVTLLTYDPVAFTVTAPPTTTTTSTSTSTTTSTTTPPASTTTTTTAAPAMTAEPNFMYPGESCLIKAQGFKPGTGVTITVFSDPLVIGTFAADANGAIAQTWTVPSGFAAGAHTVVLTGQSVAGSVELSAAITVGSVVQNTTTAAPTTVAVVTATGNLPTTGSGLTQPLLAGAAVLVLGGGTALAVSRRRRQSTR